ncbi:AlpA family phage regulatory protein [Candidatus Methylopumilus universalis]|uniref:helix-turn-helix transcriptional regulator n=1 Tax=Candidatus Methylopumilus universalis TaxID=2588536 RepID=UPI00112401B5|nr:AlpA family phage regulatory protein [Candidatus Methylopumilus universalis]QDC90056.1 AlpA family phage regulatory protein [Candidatus Methylopumilus universalis]
MSQNCFLDINQASQIASLSKSTILLWESQGRFPRAVRLSKKKRVWLESDLNDWVLKMHLANRNEDEAYDD